MRGPRSRSRTQFRVIFKHVFLFHNLNHLEFVLSGKSSSESFAVEEEDPSEDEEESEDEAESKDEIEKMGQGMTGDESMPEETDEKMDSHKNFAILLVEEFISSNESHMELVHKTLSHHGNGQMLVVRCKKMT